MRINSVHCLFEQSGTFKRCFIEKGYKAFDYDILNEFGETDFVVDLFKEIEAAFDGSSSIFDNIKSDDLIMAFFPCVRFEFQFSMHLLGNAFQMKKWSLEKKLLNSIKLMDEVNYFYSIVSKMVVVCIRKDLKLIIENPYRGNYHFLTRYWPFKPSIIDIDRSKLGDTFYKPTQYWFLNCEPMNNFNFGDDLSYKGEKDKIVNVRGAARSMLSMEYARNFIDSFILDIDSD